MATTDIDYKSRDSVPLEARPYFGVWSPLLTPLDQQLRPDISRYTEHANWLIENGCHGLTVFGTTGEANSFSCAERMEVLEGTLDAGILPERLMVGTGVCALSDTVELTRHAVRLGCKSMLMLPPFYYKGVSDEGLFRSYAEVIERIGSDDLRIILYHFPQLSGVPITYGLVELLCDAFPNIIAGIKDSSGDWNGTAQFISRFPELCIFPGSEEYLLRGLRAGGSGCITATANVNAAAIRNVYDSWLRGTAEVDKLQQEITSTRGIIARTPAIPTMKSVISHHRDDPEWTHVRPPLLPLDRERGETLLGELEAQGFIFNGSIRTTA